MVAELAAWCLPLRERPIVPPTRTAGVRAVSLSDFRLPHLQRPLEPHDARRLLDARSLGRLWRLFLNPCCRIGTSYQVLATRRRSSPVSWLTRTVSNSSSNAHLK